MQDELRADGRFGDWTPLAEGAEARIYRVRDRWTGRYAALKVASDAASRESLVREFRLLSRLRHPCLIASRDLVRDRETLAHVLEFVPAVEPRTLFEAGGEEAVWAALSQALRGITALHRHGYVHGDVAPGNILVWREGGRWRAKVADLGLALPRSEASSAPVRGTAATMAPETSRGAGYGPAADLYGLAATALHWLDGRGPWEDLSPAETLKRLVAGPDLPAPVRRVSPELAALLRGLGRGDPGARTAGEWGELRAREESWGPEVVEASVAGLEAPVAAWTEWLAGQPDRRPVAVLVRGRFGTGRRTASRALARELVASGWTALWELPLDAVRDWLEDGDEDPDPVRLARELGRRFSGRDVAVVWPERAGELESRLLRAFVVDRQEEGRESRTCVVKAVSVVGDDPDGDWLAGAVRTLDHAWTGPGPVALRALHADLYPPEERTGGVPVPPEPEPGTSPLSLLLGKRTEGVDTGGVDTATAAGARTPSGPR